MFRKEFSNREMLLVGVIFGVLAERGVNKLLEWRTEAARARFYLANPDLAKYEEDRRQTAIRTQAKTFKVEGR